MTANRLLPSPFSSANSSYLGDDDRNDDDADDADDADDGEYNDYADDDDDDDDDDDADYENDGDVDGYSRTATTLFFLRPPRLAPFL